MNNQQPDAKLSILADLPPTISLKTVTGWVRKGRPKSRFYPLVWLARVGWRLPN